MQSDSSVQSITPPAVLTIAGSDPSGGAGIQVSQFRIQAINAYYTLIITLASFQADLKTFTALQCYGMSVITSLTSQNTLGVSALQSIPPEFVKSQVRAFHLKRV